MMHDLKTNTRRNTGDLVEGRPTLEASERRARSLREGGANGRAILQADLQRLESVNQRRKLLDLEHAELRKHPGSILRRRPHRARWPDDHGFGFLGASFQQRQSCPDPR